MKDRRYITQITCYEKGQDGHKGKGISPRQGITPIEEINTEIPPPHLPPNL